MSEICGIICNCGAHGEPLACGYTEGHEGFHAWASLPSFPIYSGAAGHQLDMDRAMGQVEQMGAMRIRNVAMRLEIAAHFSRAAAEVTEDYMRVVTMLRRWADWLSTPVIEEADPVTEDD